MRFEFRLDKADWEKFPRGDEWFLFDAQVLYDSTATQLAAYEKGMGGYRVAVMLRDLGDGLGADALRAAFWISRRRAGVWENYPAFDPRVLAADIREPEEPAADDADPPEKRSPQPSQSSTENPPDTSQPTLDPGSPAPIQDSDPPTSTQ